MLLPRKKRCTKCGELKIGTNEYFSKSKLGKWGLNSQCKKCINNKKKKMNIPVNTDISITKICWKCKNELPATLDYFNRDKSSIYGVMAICKNCSKENSLKWRKENPEKEKQSEKKWRENNPEKCFNKEQRRRLKEKNQGEGISKEQWLEMMEFFGWKCAYSGEVLGKNRSIDHVIPLNKNGENEIWNMVPMMLYYNSSKQDKNMLEWYIQQEFFSEERLNKIYEWIEYAKNKYKEK